MNSGTEMFRLAKRYRNQKRTYLVINPLQAKHIPVSPSSALQMMQRLGDVLWSKYPSARLVIGFAETATAIGAVCAAGIADSCVYLQTTREPVVHVGQWFSFQEEHSHAVEQMLCAEKFQSRLDSTDTVVFVDDEITTGKTLLNMIRQMREKFPGIAEKKLVAASIFNRVSPENMACLQAAGITCEYLVKLPQEDYDAAVHSIHVQEALQSSHTVRHYTYQKLNGNSLPDPRTGVLIGYYITSCKSLSKTILSVFLREINSDEKILVLGTEECMLPALILGAELEAAHAECTVRCHATTRSPIGICPEKGYPIQNGIKLSSFYEPERTTYLYNLEKYDRILIVSDTHFQSICAVSQLANAFLQYGCAKILYVQGGLNVWYL